LVSVQFSCELGRPAGGGVGHNSLSCRAAGRKARDGDSRGVRVVAGFTLVELMVAFALMLIMVSVVYVAFDSAGRAFGVSAARLEIFEAARAAFEIMRQDFRGAIVNADGRIFRGYQYARSSSTWWGGRTTAGLPALPSEWCSECMIVYNTTRYNYLGSYTDCVWFRTTSAPEARGGLAEVVYRVRRAYTQGGPMPSAGVLERAVRTSWPPTQSSDPITVFPQRGDPDYFSIMPLVMRVYDMRFYYLNSVMQYTGPIQIGSPNRWASDCWSGQNYLKPSVWPPRQGPESWRPKGAGSPSDREDRAIPEVERRRRLPAAVMMLIRIADFQEREWTDRAINQAGIERDRDGRKQFDEIGMWFQQIFFIPNHVKTP